MYSLELEAPQKTFGVGFLFAGTITRGGGRKEIAVSSPSCRTTSVRDDFVK